MSSFDADSLKLLKMVMDYARHTDAKNGEATPRLATIEVEAFGTILAEAYDLAVTSLKSQPAAIANGEEQTLARCPASTSGR